jgi:hypothetical protein
MTSNRRITGSLAFVIPGVLDATNCIDQRLFLRDGGSESKLA